MIFRVRYQENKALGIQYRSNAVKCYRLLDETTEQGTKKQKLICTIGRWDNELPAHAVDLLTADEVREWQAWRISHDARFRRSQLQAALKALPMMLRYAKAGLEEEAGMLSKSEREKTLSALRAFMDAFEAAGQGHLVGQHKPSTTEALPPPEIGLPPLPDLNETNTPLEQAYQMLAERHKTLIARLKLPDEDI
ncbi:hypothetical protein ALP73_200059 [Pseudomonas coronafaciens pv. garcae]|uniref:hypothetical protein n=1 Tax=Pseudomonas syringae group TaxID=136849 RepID=UPI000F0105BC|nr:hypothetical protein [Pseudomonas coronafaciens]RMS04959.1 hypothetical protein ALP73_200059 [Pseudomonas coronafaciens pv. garcae]